MNMSNLPGLIYDPALLAQRIRSRLTMIEMIALMAAVCVAFYFVFLTYQKYFFPVDLFTYRNASMGILKDYYYAFWILPFFRLLSFLPDTAQVFAFYTLTIASVWFACRVFAGRFAPVVFSYNMFWIFWFGQFSGLTVGGLALMWWALVNRRYTLVAVGLMIACTKYHTVAPIALTLFLLADIPWKGRLHVIAVAAFIGVSSVLIYGLWPLEILRAITSTNPPDGSTSYTLWRWIGPLSLILWIPALFLPLSPGKRLTAIVACCALALPYFQLSDLIILLVLPIGSLLPIISNLGFAHIIYPPVLNAMIVIPLAVYVSVIWPELLARSRHFLNR
jgi:hypothetical protein